MTTAISNLRPVLLRSEQRAAENQFYAAHAGIHSLRELSPILSRVAIVLALFAVGFVGKLT